MSLLLSFSTFFENYGFLIILLLCFAGYVAYMMFKNKKDRESITSFQQNLKIGDKVVTTSGIYGTITKITDTTDGRIVTLQISENAFIDINVDAIYNVDSKTTVTENENAQPENNEVLTEEKPAEQKVETEGDKNTEEEKDISTKRKSSKKKFADK